MLDATSTVDRQTQGLIGPNAILQLRDPVETVLGPDVMAELLHVCGVDMPTGQEMIPEQDVARVHQTLRRLFPDRSRHIAQLSGAATARYIRTHRIPPLARTLLRVLPHTIGERLLTRAILMHAWTFCGSGSITARRGRGESRLRLRIIRLSILRPTTGCNVIGTPPSSPSCTRPFWVPVTTPRKQAVAGRAHPPAGLSSISPRCPYGRQSAGSIHGAGKCRGPDSNGSRWASVCDCQASAQSWGRG